MTLLQLLSLFFVLIWGAPSLAAPALPSPICLIRGQVEGTSTRVFEYDSALQKSAQLPSTHTYHDVSLNLFTSTLTTGKKHKDCTKLLQHKVFQLRDKKVSLKKDQCIEARTEFLGDEFVSGQWIFDIQQLSTENCTRN